MEELTSLAGVGRKTANVIRGNIYHDPSIVVDTHVKRISKRLGFTKEDDPVKVEYDLMLSLIHILPDEIYDIFNNDESDSTLMAILFDTSMSADETMDAIEEIRGITTKQCYLSGMSAVVTDIKDLTNKEVPFYVLIAVLLSVLVLSLTMDSAIIPLFFLLSIGMAIVYNPVSYTHLKYQKDIIRGKERMKFLDAEFVQGFIRMANDGWEQGWHERNGGNLSYRVKPEEVEMVKENFNSKEWQPIGTSVPYLAGEYFLVTGSGKYFRNVILKPEDSILSLIHI